ncbi:hypothetical protein GXW78_27295 [Roseomonas terrae]|uniref:Uncharacterized protein n=1 Tax=Neoroseomonas terrae TaxID=424799 RepID=A0ABS5EQW5_9PROT|nr:hypothetical protein [Neoroseomonas terrae]MBR0653386.1 hypothetical protein [Neoroseomonas terrae]
MRQMGIVAAVVGVLVAIVGVFTLLGSFGETNALRGAVQFNSGLSAIGGALGLLFVAALLIGLDDMRDELRQINAGLALLLSSAKAEPARPVYQTSAPPPPRPAVASRAELPPPAPRPDDPDPLMPRAEMIAKYGEQLGGSAWDLMRLGRTAGLRIPEADAVAKVKAETAKPPSYD